MTRFLLSLFFSLALMGFTFPHQIEERHDKESPYPVSEPYWEGMLQVSDLHSLHYAVYGNPQGIPVLIVHGGPGGGCVNHLTRYFDLSIWKVVMFDQRGGMRSSPRGELTDNTPQKSVDDMETLRRHLQIDRWVLFGGSWGSTLALLYGETCPERCKGFILRGVFLGRDGDVQHIVEGMKTFYPEAHAEFAGYIPEEERGQLFDAYYSRVMDPRKEVHMPAAKAFMEYDTRCASFVPDAHTVKVISQNGELCLNLAKTFLHYAKNHFYLTPNQLLKNTARVSELPCLIIQGKYDAICPPEGAYALFREWKNSMLWIVVRGGHAASEAPFAASLVSGTDLFAKHLIEEEHLALKPTGVWQKRWQSWFRSYR